MGTIGLILLAFGVFLIFEISMVLGVISLVLGFFVYWIYTHRKKVEASLKGSGLMINGFLATSKRSLVLSYYVEGARIRCSTCYEMFFGR